MTWNVREADAESLEKTAEHLMGAIEWGQTKKGEDYWQDVYANLLAEAARQRNILAGERSELKDS